MGPQTPIEEGSPGGLESASKAHLEQQARPDAQRLVSQMVAAGEWPEPALVEQILAAGYAAVEPLREVLKTRPLGWPAEAPVVHAAGILSMLRPPSALPDLIDLARFYKNETGEAVADALAAYGPEGFDVLLKLISDPSISGYHRTDFIVAAKSATGDDPVKRARLAESLRMLFTRVVGEAKEKLARERELRVCQNENELENSATDEDRQSADVEKTEDWNEIHPTEALAFLVCDLCDLADPLARDMIESAFDEDLIDKGIVNLKDVKKSYDQGGETYEPGTPWFEDYTASFLEEQSEREKIDSMPQVEFPTRASYPSFSPAKEEPPPARVQPVEPFRHAAAKIGRNDPCWCGSGKKYKKCHLGQDAPG